ncbi:MAG: hydroxymethylbilane synthase [Planctomycetaceae bacterium]|nr:hydroxymethylbilane synthase [Planctomycetaceae bacterium]
MTETTPRTIRIATRSSRLALWQAEHVSALLKIAAPEVPVEIIHVSTLGDRDLTEPLRALGAFGVFTREVQKVVQEGRADLAVHSLKDLPTDYVEGLCLAAVPTRGPVFDTLVLPANAAPGANWESLPLAARIGTGSPRRQAQVRHARPDVELLEIRGNVETRLRKLDAGEYDAIILAVAGLERLGLEGRVTQPLTPPIMFPAVGQGALGLECRTDNAWLREILLRISHPETLAAVTAERALMAELRAGCHAPLGVSTTIEGTSLRLEAVVLSPDGRARITAHATAAVTQAAALGRTVAELLKAEGADTLINAAKA